VACQFERGDNAEIARRGVSEGLQFSCIRYSVALNRPLVRLTNIVLGRFVGAEFLATS
jgi:hypothetical protein